MSLKDVEKQVWYWGGEKKEDANKALEHCLDGSYLVRVSSSPPDLTIHVVYRGQVKMIKVLVQPQCVGLSPDNMTYKSVVELIDHYSHVSLARHNRTLNVRLTNPVPKDPDDSDVFEGMTKEDETWAIYVNFVLESDIRVKKEEKVIVELGQAQEEAQRLSYKATAQHMIVQMLKEQLDIRPMALNHFSSEYLDFIKSNFQQIERRLVGAEEELEITSHQVTTVQAKVRELVLLREDMEKGKRRLYRKMDWYERCLAVEGLDNETIANGIAPFQQNLGAKILINGIKEMWFVGEMNSLDANNILGGRDNGTFMVRINSNPSYILSVVNKRKVRHIRIHENEEKQQFWLRPASLFDSVGQIVRYFEKYSLGEQDREYTTKLTTPVYMY